MESQEGSVIELELKYCERCGGLWLRVRGKDEVYCSSCALKVAELPAPTRRRVNPRLPIPNRPEISGMAMLTYLNGDGGNA
jgi:hypothetical protein